MELYLKTSRGGGSYICNTTFYLHYFQSIFRKFTTTLHQNDILAVFVTLHSNSTIPVLIKLQMKEAWSKELLKKEGRKGGRVFKLCTSYCAIKIKHSDIAL